MRVSEKCLNPSKRITYSALNKLLSSIDYDIKILNLLTYLLIGLESTHTCDLIANDS